MRGNKKLNTHSFHHKGGNEGEKGDIRPRWRFYKEGKSIFFGFCAQVRVGLSNAHASKLGHS